MTWNPANPLPPAFREVARRVYSGDPFWIPDAEEDVDHLFSADNSYFEFGRATVEVEGDLARLAGFYHPERVIDGRRAAFFGYWETADRRDVNERLFGRVETWARKQGAAVLYGPIDFSTFRRYRLRLSAPEGAGCFPGEPYNPVYYPPLLEHLGYHSVARYVTQGTARPYSEVAEEMLAAKAGTDALLAENAVGIERLTPEYWMENLDAFYPLIDLTFGQNFAYSRISRDAFRALCGEPFARRFCDRTSVVALGADGSIAGFFLCFPDYGPLVRQGAETPLRLKDISYREHFPLLDRPVFLARTLGVHPAYRRKSLMNAMASEALRRSLGLYHTGLVCLMKVDNFSVRFGQSIAEESRTYALYAKEL
jgi:GNAT superfamily N-acetyltransferase